MIRARVYVHYNVITIIPHRQSNVVIIRFEIFNDYVYMSTSNNIIIIIVTVTLLLFQKKAIRYSIALNKKKERLLMGISTLGFLPVP
jgi:hypothetical protein